MIPDALVGSQAVFTAGFSNLSADRFLNNLIAYDIDMLVDVRSRPFAGYTPHFNQDQIEVLAARAGLRYLYMGSELGGFPKDPGLYDPHGYVLYDRVAAQPWFERGIGQLMDGLLQGHRLALTCAEDNPRRCHRRLLLGRVLRERGIGVAHILANGSLISESELLDEEAAKPRQLSLFGGEPEPQWKSAQPYFPAKHAENDSVS
ncbi:MAG: DUF488 domain-containing protein [Humidesulfovibrio sp.]|uniref:DUF488 domain-containing protein n=1 Tax=Humidesulfovibrio sp. TaxID=2910988 RepID=UPI002734F685|nr:DUF488 domain-containing protein [Humidesulfovibrio sp.]MDP2846720.1 DUF488 domain-containing protein [Humidesulfovibrio sp.]